MNETIPRIKITGVITNTTALMIGSGLEIPKDANRPTYTSICLAVDNQPYIPASSLRGLLLSYCDAHYDKNSALSKTLFGSAKDNNEKETGKRGALRIYDAICLQDETGQPPKPKGIRTRNAINPVTGAARDNFLYSHAYVPEGNHFACEIEADGLSRQHIEQLLGLLEQLNASPFSQLGKGKSNQQGLVTWQLTKTEVLGKEALINWLCDGSADTSLPFLPGQFTAQQPEARPSKIKAFRLKLTPHSPLLINDPELVSKVKGEPDFEFYRNKQGQLVIPASSLKGALRGHCRKILLTLLIAKARLEITDDHSQANGLSDQLIATLFGDTSQQSKLWLSDAVAINSKPHTQTFNAVDRFTGGVADSALYTANAATATAINTRLYIKDELEDWQKGLLVLALRDAMEGDLQVGWGKAKGYGAITLNELIYQEQTVNSWTDLTGDTEHLSRMQSTLDALHRHLTQSLRESLCQNS